MDKIIDSTIGFHFTIIDNYILNDARLSAAEQIVYVHLKKYSSEDNKCFPFINSLSEVCNKNITIFVGTEYNYRLKKFEKN